MNLDETTAEEFMAGYNAGFNDCGRGGGGDFDQPDEAQPYYPPPQRGGINWEDLCNHYGQLVGIQWSEVRYSVDFRPLVLEHPRTVWIPTRDLRVFFCQVLLSHMPPGSCLMLHHGSTLM